jgi:polyhydroxybutyrate depolymerase
MQATVTVVRRLVVLVSFLVVVLGALALVPSSPASAAASSGCGVARAAGTKTHTVRAAGMTRTYHLTVPRGYRGDTRVPLVVDLHGAGSNAQQQMLLSRAREYAAERGWIVATPDAGRAFWYLQARNGEDITFVQRMVQDVARRLCIAPGRRFAMGMSNGAAMSATLTCAMPNTFAAAASVGGINIAGSCATERPRPILAVHGTADPTVPYNGGPLGGRVTGLLTVPSVPSRMAEWAVRNHCEPGPTSDVIVQAVTRIAYNGCDAPTVLLKVSRGGHTWPGGPTLPADRFGPTNHTLDATGVIFEFFAATFER